MPDQVLGTIFTGDATSFLAAVRQMREGLRSVTSGINTARDRVAQASQNISTSATHAATSLSTNLANGARQATQQVHLLEQGTRSLMSAFVSVAKYSTAGAVFYGFIQGVRNAVGEVVNFDQGLATMRAVAEASADEVEVLRDRLTGLAKTMNFSAAELIKGTVILGQAGLSAKEALSAVGPIATLASATLEDFGKVADLVTSVMAAFNMKASESGRIVDVLASAMNRSKLDIEKMRTAFNYVGATAAQAGINIEETTAMMMLLSNAGLRGSTIGTGLRQVLSRLSFQSDTLTKRFKELNINAKELDPTIVGVTGMLQGMGEAFWDVNKQAVDTGKITQIFSILGKQAATILVQGTKQAGQYAEMLKYVKMTGAANKMLELQSQGLAFQIKVVTNNIKNLVLALGEAGLTQALKGALNAMQEFTSFLTAVVSTEVGKATLTIAGMTMASLALGKALKLVVTTALAQGIWNIARAVGASIISFTTFKALLANVSIFLGTAAGAAALLSLKLIAIVTVISSLVYVIYRLLSGQDKLISSLKQQAIRFDETVENIAAYRNQLKSFTGNEFDLANDGFRLFYNEVKSKMPELIDLVRQMTSEGMALKDAMQKAFDQYEKNAAAMSVKSRVDAIREERKALEGVLKPTQLTPGGGKFRLPFLTPQAPEKFNKDVEERRNAISLSLRELAISFTEEAKKFYDKSATVEKLYAMAWRNFGGAISGLSAEDQAKFKDTAQNILSVFLQERTGEVASKEAASQRLLDQLTNDANALIVGTLSEGEAKIRLQGEIDIARLRAAKEELETRAEELDETLRPTFDKVIGRLNKAIAAMPNEINERVKAFRLQTYKTIQMAALFIKRLVAEKASIVANIAELEAPEDFEKIADLKKKYADIQAEIKKTTEMIEADTVYFGKPKELEEARKAIEEVYKAQLAQNEAERVRSISDAQKKQDKEELEDYTEVYKKYLSALEKEDPIAERYRRGIINAREYYRVLEELRNHDLISSKEYAAGMRVIQSEIYDKSNLEAFQAGLEASKESARSWKEVFFTIGAEMPRKFTDGITDGLFKAIENARTFRDVIKNAKYAFADFAQSTVRWLAEMIVRQQLYNFISGAFNFVGSTNAFTGSDAQIGALSDFYGYPARVKHTGGIIGNSPLPVRMVNAAVLANAVRLHGGGMIKHDEVPAILQKGEGVFTAEQMSALGKNELTIVNVADARAVGAYLQTTEGKNALLNVISSNRQQIKKLVLR